MIPSSSPGAVVTDGAVGRAIFQSGDWKKMQKGTGNTPVSIFLDKKSPLAISVFRLDITSDAELTQIGDDMASLRGEKRKFYGWAELSVAVGAQKVGWSLSLASSDNLRDSGVKMKSRSRHGNDYPTRCDLWCHRH